MFDVKMDEFFFRKILPMNEISELFSKLIKFVI